MAPQAPPGRTTRPLHRRVLLLAPHYDDEVLGCGGLLVQLAQGGAEIRVLYLSDSSGGAEGAENPLAYSWQRRQESARALEVLGVPCTARHLELTDGALATHRDPIVSALRFALGEARPDLVLVPSPLEVSPDHRAAFAALHELLAPLRRDSELFGILADTAFFAYEVNHPLYADTLVDVTPQVDTLRRALAVFESQQQRHDYLEVAMGLRRFRVLTLGPGVAAAEGYRRLGLLDFVTRSEAQLVAAMGGSTEAAEVSSAPSVSVVVRTFNRPGLLQETLDSLASNHYGPLEIVLVNDGGASPEVRADRYPFELVRVDLESNRGRAGAAQAGLEAATGDYLGFLDDDDVLAPEHLATLSSTVQAAGVQVVYSDAAVGVYDLAPGDGATAGGGWTLRERRLPYSRDFDPELLLVDNYIPFLTLLMERKLAEAAGPFDESLGTLEDWDFLIRLAGHARFRHLRRVTCEYRHFQGSPDSSVHELGPTGGATTDLVTAKARVIGKHAARVTPELLARVVQRLRDEAVLALDRVARLEAAAARSRIGDG